MKNKNKLGMILAFSPILLIWVIPLFLNLFVRLIFGSPIANLISSIIVFCGFVSLITAFPYGVYLIFKNNNEKELGNGPKI